MSTERIPRKKWKWTWKNDTQRLFCSINPSFIHSYIHRCLRGDNDSCKCEDPLEPQSRGEFRAWAKAQNANVAFVDSLIEQGKAAPDIAFLGASVVEEMSGKWFGVDKDENLKSLKRMFDKNFKKSEGADLEAVALGIAGDTVRCANAAEA